MTSKKTFSTRAAAGATKHAITISVPTFDELTDAQRRGVYAYAVSRIVVKIQDPLRTAIEKGTRGEALNAEAQRRFNAALDGMRLVAAPVTIDLNAAEFRDLPKAAVDALRKTGARIIERTNAKAAQAAAAVKLTGPQPPATK